MTAVSVPAPLLATKLYLPAPRATAVTRSRLVAHLRSGVRSRLTLIAAPAGFGKSTLLAQTLAEYTHNQSAGGSALEVAWVALDGSDNDPTRFWSYVCTAFERASPGVGAPALAMLHSAAVEPALAELLNTLAGHARNVALVLDDYHTITSPAIHEAVSFLLDHAPPQFHLVIASRIDPPLPLARWRARGELTEIRAAELRFTTDEAVQFLGETMGLRLDSEAAAALEARTEGWAAGLQLAALSLQGQANVRGFIDTFSGSHRHVVDYLLEEVLNRQPDHIRAFLLQTSILERMCAELCETLLRKDKGAASNGATADSITEHPSSAILTELDRQNLFLIPLDNERRWYRYHHLFADLLRHRLQHERPAIVSELHRRAAHWFEQQGAATEAVDHALAAADIDLVARLLTAHGSRFSANGETQTLQRWLDALPHEQLLSNPRLCLSQAWVLMLNRQVAAIEPYLNAAEAALQATDRQATMGVYGELLALRAHTAIERGAYADALAQAQQALELLPPTELWARSCSSLVLGYALYVLGHTSEAVAAHAENVSLCRAAGNPVSALFSATEVIKLRVLQGRLGEARVSGEQSLAWAASEGWQQLPPASALHIWLGNTFIEMGDFPAADAQLRSAIRLTQNGPGITAARAQIFLARLRQIEGNRDGANAALAAVEQICRNWEPSGERAFFRAYVARVRLLRGDEAAATRWASEQAAWDRSEVPSYFRELELLTLARVAVLSESQSTGAAQEIQAHALLQWLRDHAIDGGRGAVIIETLALEAIAFARCGAMAQAHDRLDEALGHAAPEGFVGIFVDLGAPMAALLRQNLARRAANDPLRPYLARLLQLFAANEPEQPPQEAEAPAPRPGRAASVGAEMLTEREIEVLRLFAAGMTSTEIAQHFVVSINTVKTQLKSIYSKLDSHSRAEAVARARDLRLIS